MLAQRRGFREYLAGLLLPRDRNKTLTCLAGTEPVVGAQHAAVPCWRVRTALAREQVESGAVWAERDDVSGDDSVLTWANEISAACTTAVSDLLADCAPGLLRALREVDRDYVLLDGALAECDRVGDSRADYSPEHR